METDEIQPVSDSQVPLLIGNAQLHTGDGSVDTNGDRALKTNTGNWKACWFILGTECCERLAYFGILTNLVTYLTTYFHENNVSAAAKVTTWSGTSYLTPLIGAILADACWGRYRTILVSSVIYLLGVCTLTLSALVPAFKPPDCDESDCPSATPTQYGVFYLGLYMIALGTGGIKPCVSSFGADQFDETDQTERAKKYSFYNWYYFCINIGALVASTIIVWVQVSAGWGVGCGILAFSMTISIVSFLAGTRFYRYQRLGGNPLKRICQVLVASYRKRNVEVPADGDSFHERQMGEIEGGRKLLRSDGLRALDKAALKLDGEEETEGFPNAWRLCTVTQVEELKIVMRMFPIWATGIFFSTVYAQMSTTFVEQGLKMVRTVGSFTIPAASMSTFNILSVIICVPVYDKLIVPRVRRYTGREKGFTQLQRMGIGLFISALAMAVAAAVEIWRLHIGNDLELTDQKGVVQISIFWQIPQYFLIGAAEIFTYIGQNDFSYVEAPEAMRSLCSGLGLATTSMGNYLNSLILTIVTYLTTRKGSLGWIPENLNKGHLDYYFWLLAGLSIVNLIAYTFCAKKFNPKITAPQ